jgi:membrane protein YqaA with SNARE-associated domain
MSVVSKTDKVIERLSKSERVVPTLFVVAFLEASISPVLPEALLLVVLAYRKDISWKFLAAVSAFGSACGALVMYALGFFLFDEFGKAILSFLHGEQLADHARNLFADNAFIAQWTAALTPLPDRVFSFLAGAFKVSLPVMFAATFLGRLVRAGVVSYLSYEYGDEARVYIKRHTKNVLIAVLLISVGYFVYRFYQS